MTNEKAIELLNKALRCVQTDPRNCGECKKCENYATKEDGIEAIRMALAALGKAPTALDHIHNVVSDNAFGKGYDAGYADGYERGRNDTATSLARQITTEYDEVLGVEDVLAEIDNLLAVAEGE